MVETDNRLWKGTAIIIVHLAKDRNCCHEADDSQSHQHNVKKEHNSDLINLYKT